MAEGERVGASAIMAAFTGAVVARVSVNELIITS